MADTEIAAPAAVAPTTQDPKPESAEGNNDTKADNKAAETEAVEGEKTWAIKASDKSNERGGRRDRDDRNGRNGGHGRGRNNFQHNNQRNKKRNNEFQDLPETDDPELIRQQIEFYFTDHNLGTDEHMFKELEGPKNRAVDLKHITTFKRMRRFQPYSAVVKAVRDSERLEVVGDNGHEAVKRKDPLVIPSEKDDESNPPTIEKLFYRFRNLSKNNVETCAYVKNFGDESQAGQMAIEDFMRPYGSLMVRKRRDDDGNWKGSVFVEFNSEDSQKQFINLDPKPKFNGNELEILGKKEYMIKKCAEKGIKPDWELTPEELAAKRREDRESRNINDRGRGRNNNSHGGRGSRGGREGRGGGSGRGNRGRGGGGGDRYRNRSRSPRQRRARSGSVDGDNWKERRNRYQQGKDDSGKERKEVEKDEHGVPIIKATKPEDEGAAASNKRKAGGDERESSPKKSKIEFKEDA